jgi:basic membrane protein A
MPLDKDSVKIGIIHVSDATDGYSYAHDAGIQQMQAAIGLGDEQIIRKLNVSDTDELMTEHVIRECIAEGANVIIATSWGYMNICEKLAAEYPGVVFAHASGYKSNESNFTNYFGRIYQARYLSGIAAGLLTKSGKLGYVAAMDKTNSEVAGGLNAFALGVESVNPEARIYVRVTNSWFDPVGEQHAALRLLAEGCDVIAQHCDTSVPQSEAEKVGAWGIGYNSDMRADAPNAVLTSVIWNWDVYYTYLIGGIIDGSFTTAPYFGGLAEGIVDITPLSDALSTPEIAKAVAEAREHLLNGEANVFDGVMETNDGQKIGLAGDTLSDDEITGGINWYYRNIIELE